MCWFMTLHGYVNFIYPYNADTTLSVQRLLTRWRVRSSKAIRGKRFSVLHARSDWPWGQSFVEWAMLVLFSRTKAVQMWRSAYAPSLASCLRMSASI
jgi:hypothetical protein